MRRRFYGPEAETIPPKVSPKEDIKSGAALLRAGEKTADRGRCSRFYACPVVQAQTGSSSGARQFCGKSASRCP